MKRPLLTAPVLCLLLAGALSATPTRVLDQGAHLNRNSTLEVPGYEVALSAGFPLRVLGADPTAVQRPLTSFAAPSDTLWTITTPYEGFVSTDKGRSWAKVLDREAFKPGANLSALAGNPLTPGTWAAGTTFHGLFVSTDNAKTWKVFDDFETAYKYDDGAREPIHTVAWSAKTPGQLWAFAGKEGGHLWQLDTVTAKKTLWAFPGGSYLDLPEALASHVENGAEIVEVRTRTAWWRYEVVPDKWTKLEDRTDVPVWDAGKRERMEKSKDKLGFYVSAYQAARPELLKGHLDFMAKNGLNAIVIDFKNDFGEINYDSKVPFAITAKLAKPVFNAPDLIKKVHERGFYLIARVVVFKDNRLYKYNNYQYALYDSATKKPWGDVITETAADGTTSQVQKEFWVDTYNQDVWAYNIALAKELQTLGVDEIQFDYIRFPSDGPVNRIVNRAKVPGMNRIDALEGFLKGAREALSIPLSVDIYGYNGYFITDHLGQNLPMLAKYVDAISPMFYPSHFFRSFLPKYSYLDRAQIIYQDGSDRTWMNTNRQVHVRPWVQTFLIGGELKFDDQTISNYVDRQLTGVDKSKASGFLLWNSSNRYYMVTKPVTPFATTTYLPY
ncbi:MAG: putative glycoside hydrolase [Spirochaetales bacterium]